MIQIENAPWRTDPALAGTAPALAAAVNATVGVADADFIAEGHYYVVSCDDQAKTYEGNAYTAKYLTLRNATTNETVSLNLRKGKSHVLYGEREEVRITGNWLSQLPLMVATTKWGAVVNYRAQCPVTEQGIKPIQLDLYQI